MHFNSGDFQIQVFNTIQQVEVTWDKFHSHAQQLNSRYLSALEEADPADMEFRYVVISLENKVVACAYLQLVNFSNRNFSEQGNPFLLLFLKLFFRFKKVRLLFCGNLFRVDFPCYHYEPSQISFDRLLKIILQFNSLEKCHLMMMKEMNLPDEQLKVLQEHGFRKYDEDLTMALVLRSSWNSFDDYYQSLTKKYRKRLRMIRAAKERLTVRSLSLHEINSHMPEISALFIQTASRQFLKMGIIDERYFLSMSKAFGEKFFINGYFLDDKLIAFASHLNHADMLEVHYIGIDYTYNEKYFLYFNILYDGIGQAIGMKKKSLDLGRTAREAKASAGCEPVPAYDYLYVANRFIDFLIRIFEKLFLEKMGDEWHSRNPFKKN